MFVLKILQKQSQAEFGNMAEGIHKVAVGGRQKKPFEQLIFQWISEARLDMLTESVLKCGITITTICFYKPDVFSICNCTVIMKYLFLYFLYSFLQNLLKIGVRIIHGRALYTDKYGCVSLLT